jgi:hypothetical protein
MYNTLQSGGDRKDCIMGLAGHQEKKNVENKMFHLDRCSMCIWCKASALHIIFHAKGKEIEPHYNTLYFNNNEPDQPENLFKHYLKFMIITKIQLLGVYLDEHLNCNHHWSLSHPCDWKLTGLICSHLLYCINIIILTSQSNICE